VVSSSSPSRKLLSSFLNFLSVYLFIYLCIYYDIVLKVNQKKKVQKTIMYELKFCRAVNIYCTYIFYQYARVCV